MYKFGVNFESRAKKTTDGLNRRKGRGKKKKACWFLSSSLNGERIIKMRNTGHESGLGKSLLYPSRQPLKYHQEISRCDCCTSLDIPTSFPMPSIISFIRFCECKTPLLDKRQFYKETLMRIDGGKLGQSSNLEIPCVFSPEQDPGSSGWAPVSKSQWLTHVTRCLPMCLEKGLILQEPAREEIFLHFTFKDTSEERIKLEYHQF